MPTKIDWCDEVWNPVTGCTKVSEGCQNCYAEAMARRFWKGRSFSDVQCHESRLDIPMHWKKPRVVFVNSMSDLFHPDVPFNFIDKVFVIMQEASWHRFIFLTKREDRMLKYYQRLEGENRFIHLEYAMNAMNRPAPKVTWYPFPNVWPGISVEDQDAANKRVPKILQVPAAKRIVCVEPMLGPVDLVHSVHRLDGMTLNPGGIDWVICGQETGTGARHFHPVWAMGLKKQCDIAGVPFWWKNHPEYQEKPA